MKSSSGHYFIGLDHIRAVAALVVFIWHFNIHFGIGHQTPIYPLSILSEGHTGVALFMVLSGYLFAKLLEGRAIHYGAFFWNRFLRLAPLLFAVLLIYGVQDAYRGEDVMAYVFKVLSGVVMPSLPHGGWSITVEAHFYLLLPLLLALLRRKPAALFGVLVVAVAFRGVLYASQGTIQIASYLTIVGRIDQFLLGILAYQYRDKLTGQHLKFAAVWALFLGFFWYFSSLGGFYQNGGYPSPSAIWIFVPLAEGVAYAFLVAWYDNSFKHTTGPISRFVAAIGTYSYSIYLLHFMVVGTLARAVRQFVDVENVLWSTALGSICFLVMVPIGYLSFTYWEKPFLRFRKRYTIRRETESAEPALTSTPATQKSAP
ncbi:MAG: acyltransferase family protein [Opitutales bacterium]